MFSFCALVSLTCALLATAQSNNTALNIEAIEAHFNQAGITPGLFSPFDPIAVLSLEFDGVNGDISPGQPLTKTQVAPTPKLSVTGANSSETFADTYTVAMVDAGPVGTDDSKGVTRHWLVNGVKITGNTVDTNGTAITQYAGPAPPAGTGPHRYVILIYLQPSSFTAPAAFSKPNMGVSVFDLGDYVKSSNLGPVIAGIYFTVEEGTATATLSSTSAVVTSTLPIPSGTSSPKPSTGGALALREGVFSLFVFAGPLLALALF